MYFQLYGYTVPYTSDVQLMLYASFFTCPLLSSLLFKYRLNRSMHHLSVAFI